MTDVKPPHTRPAPAYGDPNDVSSYQAEGSTIARLMAAYPHLFQNGAPYWSDLPEGWYGLATEFMDLVDRHLGRGLAPYFRIDQCKEKFAGLRVYWSLHGRARLSGAPAVTDLPPTHRDQDSDDEIELDADGEEIPRLNPLVAVAIECARSAIREEAPAILDRSLLTCQECAAPGRVRRFAWMRTLCDGCATAFEQRHGEREITLAERHRGVHPGGRIGGSDSGCDGGSVGGSDGVDDVLA